MAMKLPKLQSVDSTRPKKKKILILSDDLRMSSGVGRMSKEIVCGTIDKYDWVQIAGAIKHPDEGKAIDMNQTMIDETGVKDAYLKILLKFGIDKNFDLHMNKKISYEFLQGIQLPIAGFRGSGLAWMVDILSGVLTGGNHAGRVKDPFDDFSGPQNIGHLFITFKTNLFVKNYNNRIKDNIKKIKRLPKLKGVKKIVYPGQNKYKRFKMNSKKEIKISKIIKKDLEILKN